MRKTIKQKIAFCRSHTKTSCHSLRELFSLINSIKRSAASLFLVLLFSLLFISCDMSLIEDKEDAPENTAEVPYEEEYGIIESTSIISGVIYLGEDGTISSLRPDLDIPVLKTLKPAVSALRKATTRDSLPVEISGKIRLVVGDKEYSFDGSSVKSAAQYYEENPDKFDTPPAGNYYVIPVEIETEYYGSISFITLCEITIDSVEVAAYASGIIVITPNTNINLNDTDGDSTEDIEGWIRPLLPVEGAKLTDIPVISNITLPENTTDAFASVTATIENTDLTCCSILINKHFKLIQLDVDSTSYSATLDEVVDLIPGANEVAIVAVNRNGICISEKKTITYTKPEYVKGASIYVTLTWDGKTSDIDLHTWMFSSESMKQQWHCYYGNMDITGNPGDNLDVDDIEGFGPEHFTLYDYTDGYYVIALNSYDLDYDKETSANISVSVAGDEAFYGPFNFTTDNGESYPVNSSSAWHRVCDIRITDGKAEFLEPDLSIKPEGDSNRGLNLIRKKR